MRLNGDLCEEKNNASHQAYTVLDSISLLSRWFLREAENGDSHLFVSLKNDPSNDVCISSSLY